MFQMGRKIEKKELVQYEIIISTTWNTYYVHSTQTYYCFVMAWIEHRHSQHGVWNSIEVSWIFDLIITFSLLHNSNIRNVVMAPTFFTEFDSPAKPSEIKERKKNSWHSWCQFYWKSNKKCLIHIVIVIVNIELSLMYDRGKTGYTTLFSVVRLLGRHFIQFLNAFVFLFYYSFCSLVITSRHSVIFNISIDIFLMFKFHCFRWH